MCDFTWYNPERLSQLHGYSFENFFNTGRKGIYDLTCDIDSCDRQNPPTEPENASSGGGRHLSSTSSINSLVSLGNTLHFINQWIQ